MTDYLDLEDLLAAAAATLGPAFEIRDVGLLEAAIARPKASVFGADAYRDLDAKAGALLHSIVAGHALVDGNKRLGWVATRLFYRVNDRDLRMSPDVAFDVVMDVAAARLTDVDAIAARLAPWVEPMAPA